MHQETGFPLTTKASLDTKKNVKINIHVGLGEVKQTTKIPAMIIIMVTKLPRSVRPVIVEKYRKHQRLERMISF